MAGSQRCPFCTAQGSELAEDLEFQKYKRLLGRPESDKKLLVEFFFKKEAVKRDNSAAVKSELADVTNKLEKLGDKAPEVLPKHDREIIKELLPSYDPATAVARRSFGRTEIHPVDMTEAQWGVVLNSNNLLSGNCVTVNPVKRDEKDTKHVVIIERALHPAFRLKPRELLSAEKPLLQAAPGKGTSGTTQASPANDDKPFGPRRETEKKTDTTHGSSPPEVPQSEPHKLSYRIPLFRVADGSSVEVFETKNAMTSAMARECFSQTDVEAEAGGGAGGFSAAAKVSLNEEHKNMLTEASNSQEAVMHMSYNFPMVKLELNSDLLELTYECVEELNKLFGKGDQVSTSDLNRFYDKFGHYYPTRVVLGGRLYFSQKSDWFGSGTIRERSRAMKTAAGLSFSSPFVQGSASASHQTKDDSYQANENKTFNNVVTWNAQGGDTTLCNNPPEWCQTVNTYYNWRVIQQSAPKNILNLISEILHSNVPALNQIKMIKKKFGIV